MLNQITLVGNLGADPEVFFSSEGDQVTSFNLAFRASKKNTGWIKVTCFNKLAEIASNHLHKGARIGIQGALDQHHWNAQDGSPRSSFQILANSIEFIKTDGRGFKEGDKERQPGDEDVPF
jgi:single-strand DNA-binding protein